MMHSPDHDAAHQRSQKIFTTGLGLLGLVAAALILSGTLMIGCKGPYDAAWRTLDAVQKAQSLTAQQLAQAAEVKRKECIKAHGAKTSGYAKCIDIHRKALKSWQDAARPSINTAVQVTATAVQIAEKVDADKKVDWIQLLAPAVCSLGRALKSFGHLFSDGAKTVLGLLAPLEGVTCNE